jgi:hypothetical protein
MAELNTQFPPGLEGLFGQAPALAALQWGDQQRTALENNRSLQDAFRMQQQQEQEMFPIKKQREQALTEGTQANTAATQLQTKTKQATYDSDVQAHNSANRTKIGADELAQTEQFGSTLGQLAGRLAAMPPMMRAAAAKQALTPYMKDHPEFDNLLVTNADNLPQYFKDYSDNILKNSKWYRELDAREARELKKVEAQGANAKEVARIGAASRENVANTRANQPEPPESAVIAKMGYEKATVYYAAKADEAEAAGQTDRAAAYRAKSEKFAATRQLDMILRAASAQGGKVDLNALGIQTKPQVEPVGTAVPKGFSNPVPQGKVAVISPDGKRGFIPQAQLEEAIKSGYKKAQ